MTFHRRCISVPHERFNKSLTVPRELFLTRVYNRIWTIWKWQIRVVCRYYGAVLTPLCGLWRLQPYTFLKHTYMLITNTVTSDFCKCNCSQGNSSISCFLYVFTSLDHWHLPLSIFTSLELWFSVTVVKDTTVTSDSQWQLYWTRQWLQINGDSRSGHDTTVTSDLVTTRQ